MASSVSTVQTVLGPALEGVWVHDPEDPEGTLRHFLYAPSGRQESRSRAAEMLQFAGRSLPVAEFGEAETNALDVRLLVPAGEEWAGSVESVKDLYRVARTIAYRDNRGRAWYGVLRSIKLTDAAEGTGVDFTLDRVYYSAVPASLQVSTMEAE